MLTEADFPLNAIVSFDLHPSALLGAGFQRAKVLAHLDADTAKYWIDPPAVHANVYPLLPPGVPNKFDGYPYLKLKLASGQVTAIGVPWIKDETLVVATTRTMRVSLVSITPAQQDQVIQALSSNGFSGFEVEYID